MWIDDFGHPSVRVSQQLAQESELSIQPLSSETTWLSTVSPEIISRVCFIISPAMFIFICLFVLQEEMCTFISMRKSAMMRKSFSTIWVVTSGSQQRRNSVSMKVNKTADF